MIYPRLPQIFNKHHTLKPIILWGIVLVGAILRFTNLGKQPLWMDEAYSVWMSQQSIPDIIKLTIQIDQHPPLYHLLLHFWNVLGGTSEFWVRSFSALLGVLTILTIYDLGKTLSGWEVGLFSALLLALSPFQVEFSQEARSYTLLTLVACLSMDMLLRLLTVNYVPGLVIGDQFKEFFRSLKFRRAVHVQSAGAVHGMISRLHHTLLAVRVDLCWLGYMAFSALAVYTHNTAALLPVGINLFVFGLILYRRFFPAREGQFQAPSLKNWLLAQIGMALFWLPWASSFIIQTAGVVANFWIPPPTFTLVVNTLKNFLLAWVPDRLSFPALIWLGFIGLFVFAVVKNRDRLSRITFLAALFLTPFLGELLVSLYRPIFYDRTLIWSAIPLYVLLAEGISYLRFRSYIFTALAILVTLNLISLANYFSYFEKERWDLAAQFVDKNFQPGDMILFNANWAEIPFDYYFTPLRQSAAEFGAPETMFENGVLEPRMTRADLPRLRRLIQGHNRVWLVYSHNWWTDPYALIQKELNAHMHLMDVQMFNGMQIQLYRQP